MIKSRVFRSFLDSLETKILFIYQDKNRHLLVNGRTAFLPALWIDFRQRYLSVDKVFFMMQILIRYIRLDSVRAFIRLKMLILKYQIPKPHPPQLGWKL